MRHPNTEAAGAPQPGEPHVLSIRLGLEQRAGQGGPRSGHPRIGGPHDLKELQEVQPRAVTAFSAAAANGLDEPSEGVLDVTAGDVQVCRERLGRNVVGLVGSGLPGPQGIDATDSLEQLHPRKAGGGLGVSRTLVEQLLERCRRAVEITGVDGRLSGC
jgi:hypothetical protein